MERRAARIAIPLAGIAPAAGGGVGAPRGQAAAGFQEPSGGSARWARARQRTAQPASVESREPVITAARI